MCIYIYMYICIYICTYVSAQTCIEFHITKTSSYGYIYIYVCQPPSRIHRFRLFESHHVNIA